MSKRLHLINRYGVFYWRRRLTASMAKAAGRSHWKLSLSTRDPKIAQRIARRLSYEFDCFLAEMSLQKRTPTASEQEKLFRALYRSILEECETERLRRYPVEEIPGGAVQYRADGTDSVNPVPMSERDRRAFYRFPALSSQRMQAYGVENRFAPIRTLLTPHLAGIGIDGSADDTAFRHFLSQSLLIAVRAFDDAARGVNTPAFQSLVETIAGMDQRADNPDHEKSHGTSRSADRAPVPEVPIVEPAKPETLSVFVDHYIKRESGHIAKSTLGKKHNSLKILLKVTGDVPAPGIDRNTAERLHDLLERLPASYGKSEHDSARQLEAVVKTAPGPETMAQGTLIKHWKHIKEFYGFLNRRPGVPKIDVEEVFGKLRWNRNVRPLGRMGSRQSPCGPAFLLPEHCAGNINDA